MRHAGRSLLAAVLASLFLASCTGEGEAPSRSAVGASTVSIVADDGVLLDGRYWDHNADRIVIYLHEYREEQSSWWSWAAAQRRPTASAITLDLRGHGASEGLETDIAAMVLDVRAAIEFARDAGYPHVMLVGAGMSAAVAIVAAADEPEVTVLGLSTPAEFGELLPVEALQQTPGLADRVWLMASEDDVSAADSLHRFREVAGVPFSQSRLFAGRTHGIALLEGIDGTAARRLTEAVVAEFWVVVR